MISLAIQKMVIDSIEQLAMKAGENYIGEKINKRKVQEKLHNYLEQQRKLNIMCRLAEEIDFQGLVEYIEGNFLEDVSTRVFCANSIKREKGRSSVINAAITFSKANTAQSRWRVTRLVNAAIGIIRDFYKKGISKNDLFLADEIVEAVSQNTQQTERRLTEQIQGVQAAVESTIKSTATTAIDNKVKLAMQGDQQLLEKTFQADFAAVSVFHPLHPDYGYMMSKDRLISQPLTPQAQEKYPPGFIVKGKAKMGNRVISGINADTLKYADNHQLILTLEIEEAKKLLGTEPDPAQAEAEEMVGITLVRKPHPFPPAFPCQLRIDGCIIYDYIELRTKELLDDGTYVITNEEQTERKIDFEIRINLQIHNHPISVRMHPINESNRGILDYLCMVKKLNSGGELSVYSLRNGTDIIQGTLNSLAYKSKFGSIDDEISFAKGLCVIEDYYGITIETPRQFYESDVANVEYMSTILQGLEFRSPLPEMKLTTNLDTEFKEAIQSLTGDMFTFATHGESEIKLFGKIYPVRVVRIFVNAVMRDLETIKEIAQTLEIGETISFTLGPGVDSMYIDTLETDEQVEKLRLS